MKIKISFFAAVLLLTLIVSWGYTALIFIAAIVIHECGHIVAARLRKIGFSEFSFNMLGANLKISDNMFSCADTIAVCICGPFANAVSAVLARLIFSACEARSIFLVASVSLCVLNLLPIESFDGYRIVKAILQGCVRSRTLEHVMNLLSLACIAFIWAFSVYLLLRVGASISLFVFSLSLFSKIYISKREQC